MNHLSLLTLLLFFVLQALIYTACLFKLAEIRRQNLSSRVKLKLIENEDQLFDAGLYLGFAGTIISLILVSLGNPAKPHGCLFLYLLRHYFRFDLQDLSCAPRQAHVVTRG